MSQKAATHTPSREAAKALSHQGSHHARLSRIRDLGGLAPWRDPEAMAVRLGVSPRESPQVPQVVTQGLQTPIVRAALDCYPVTRRYRNI